MPTSVKKRITVRELREHPERYPHIAQAAESFKPLVARFLAAKKEAEQVFEHLRGADMDEAVAATPSVTPELELCALKRTRSALRHLAMERAAAMFFTVLPAVFVVDNGHVRFLFADYPGLIVGMAITATVFWLRAYWKKHCNEALK